MLSFLTAGTGPWGGVPDPSMTFRLITVAVAEIAAIIWKLMGALGVIFT